MSEEHKVILKDKYALVNIVTTSDKHPLKSLETVKIKGRGRGGASFRGIALFLGS